MADSGYYVGACPDCNVVLDDAHAQNSAPSATRAPTRVGTSSSRTPSSTTTRPACRTNSQNNDDAPSPQDGACPADGDRAHRHHALLGVHQDNYVHDNNNPNVPGTGSAELGPPGTGIVIVGRAQRHRHQQHVRQQRQLGGPHRAVHRHRHAAADRPLRRRHAQLAGHRLLLLRRLGQRDRRQHLQRQRHFGNPTNGDLGDISDPQPTDPGNCWHANTDAGGLTSAPADLPPPTPRAVR